MSVQPPDPALAGLGETMVSLAAELSGVVAGAAGLADLADKADETVVHAARLQIRLAEGDKAGALAAADVLREAVVAIQAELARRP